MNAPVQWRCQMRTVSGWVEWGVYPTQAAAAAAVASMKRSWPTGLFRIKMG